jgi:hypothetical protein
MELNHNIFTFKCLVKNSYFTKDESTEGFSNCYAFAIQSVPGRILTFHIMTDYGMLRSRVPLSEIYFSENIELDLSPDFKQLWDCFSENVSVIEYGYLENKRCQVVLKDGQKVWGTYMFTVDWYSNPYSDEPSDYKCGHVIKADNGYLLCQPNNRIFWKDMNFVTKEFPVDKKSMKVDTDFISVESFSDRWVSEDTDGFYYEIKQNG